ncbi:hypothetical protein [Streptomyces decoyicus]|uniref:hypothetical protein n=1 Tax=Streptomyces decoyicus TaxID=249567 RepID=UPI0038659693
MSAEALYRFLALYWGVMTMEPELRARADAALGKDRWKILAEVEDAANELVESANTFVQDASAHLNGRRLRPSLRWRVGRILRHRESMNRSEFSPRLNLGQGVPLDLPDRMRSGSTAPPE